MKIFSEHKNKYILAAIQLIDRIYNGEEIAVRDFEKEILKEADDNGIGVGLNFITKLKNDCRIFDFSDKNRIRLNINSPVPIMMTLMEKIWLKNALEDDRMHLFIADELIHKLKQKLIGIPDFNANEFIDIHGLSYNKDVIDDAFINKFQTALKAIDTGSYLIYSNIDREGRLYKDEKAVPFKIEYSITQQRFRLSLWSMKERRPVKTNLSSMFDLSIGTEVEKREQGSIKEMMERKKAPEPIVLKIFNRSNSIERASLLLSQYDRKVRWDDKDALIMEISYYSFDEDEIFNHILSFGPSVKVVSPGKMADRVKERIHCSQTYILQQGDINYGNGSLL
jgi:hypothetical protein